MTRLTTAFILLVAIMAIPAGIVVFTFSRGIESDEFGPITDSVPNTPKFAHIRRMRQLLPKLSARGWIKVDLPGPPTFDLDRDEIGGMYFLSADSVSLMICRRSAEGFQPDVRTALDQELQPLMEMLPKEDRDALQLLLSEAEAIYAEDVKLGESSQPKTRSRYEITWHEMVPTGQSWLTLNRRHYKLRLESKSPDNWIEVILQDDVHSAASAALTVSLSPRDE